MAESKAKIRDAIMTNYKHMPHTTLHPPAAPFLRFALFIFKTITRHIVIILDKLYILIEGSHETDWKNVCGKQWKEAATDT